MAYWLLLFYLLYGAGLGAWIGEHANMIAWRVLVAVDAASELVLALKHTIKAAG
jgi:riboflavin transporter FmnP